MIMDENVAQNEVFLIMFFFLLPANDLISRSCGVVCMQAKVRSMM